MQIIIKCIIQKSSAAMREIREEKKERKRKRQTTSYVKVLY